GIPDHGNLHGSEMDVPSARLNRASSNKKSAPRSTTPMVVSGGYCQHTEGFGEMAEETNRRRASQRQIELSPLAVALSELKLRSPHPAGAPPRPPEPACRGEPSIHLDAGRPCVTRSSTLRCRRSVAALPTSSSGASWSSSLPLSSLFSSSPLLPS